ncbi:MAG: hypothetical protein K8T10_12160 [Candidatus Eremiobacteraeota bacterium]|nr:hypothetical protein [Candidatus Eremiobacteraeota bacterium]
MERLIREFNKLIVNIDFKRFQNEFSLSIYDALGQGYSKSENEVSLVTRLVDTIKNSAQYRNLSFHSKKIHGSRSYVEFNFRDKPVTKELADMLVISVATYKRKRIVQKITFIQNKVDSKRSWKIDEEQLFLLKNFPSFSGKKGIFRQFGQKDIVFLNHSKCLGSYGLFMEPGEMIFLSAPLVADMKKNKSIAEKDIRYLEENRSYGNNFNFSPYLDPMILEDMIHYLYKYCRKGHYSFPFFSGQNSEFLGNTIFARDIHDFIREWTFFNIGETTFINDSVVNPLLDDFTNNILRAIGMGEHINIPESNNQPKFESETAVFVMHLGIKE